MKCPRDGEELTESVYEADVQVERCPACAGVWLDKGELERIQESVQNDHSEELSNVPNFAVRAYEMARQEAERRLTCPRCDQSFRREEYGYCSQILVDVCPACEGIWLDRSELQALEVFFERSSAPTGEIRKGFLAKLRDLF